MIELGIAHQVCTRLREQIERRDGWQAARAAANQAGRPLLNVGCGASQVFQSACGDVCLDVDPRRLAHCQAPVQCLGDVRSIPYPDGYFGAAIVCHVLEHMPTVADAERALRELQRVAGRVWVVSPGLDYIPNWLTPDHYLWVRQATDGQITFEQRERGESVGEWWHPLLRAIWDFKTDLETASQRKPAKQAPLGADSSPVLKVG